MQKNILFPIINKVETVQNNCRCIYVHNVVTKRKSATLNSTVPNIEEYIVSNNTQKLKLSKKTFVFA